MSYICAFSTLCMCGLVWFVQVVHYPLFANVGDAAFAEYHALHSRRTTWIVAPLMITELGSSAILAVTRHTALAGTGAGLAATTWILTFALAVPLHTRLGNRFDPATVRQLVMANLTRAVVWAGHGVVALALIR